MLDGEVRMLAYDLLKGRWFDRLGFLGFRLNHLAAHAWGVQGFVTTRTN